jgi:hypothetical protein
MMARSWRLLRRHAAAVLPLVALVELALHQYHARRAPRFDEYARLGTLARSLAPGELVTVAPRWAEPMVRAALGNRLMPLRDIARSDNDGYARAVEIGILGEHDPELDGWTVEAAERLGPFRIRRLVNPRPAPAQVDFVDALGPTARVYVSTDPNRPCSYSDRAPVTAGGLGGPPTFPRRRFTCPGSPFINVGVTVVADELFRPRRCLWAHPPRVGELTIELGRLGLGSRIVGHGGMYWMTERERTGAPVELAVSVDGDEIGRVIHADGEGWARFELGLGRHAGARAATVRFAVSSPDYRHRHFCFEARSQ